MAHGSELNGPTHRKPGSGHRKQESAGPTVRVAVGAAGGASGPWLRKLQDYLCDPALVGHLLFTFDFFFRFGSEMCEAGRSPVPLNDVLCVSALRSLGSVSRSRPGAHCVGPRRFPGALCGPSPLCDGTRLSVCACCVARGTLSLSVSGRSALGRSLSQRSLCQGPLFGSGLRAVCVGARPLSVSEPGTLCTPCCRRFCVGPGARVQLQPGKASACSVVEKQPPPCRGGELKLRLPFWRKDGLRP